MKNGTRNVFWLAAAAMLATGSLASAQIARKEKLASTYIDAAYLNGSLSVGTQRTAIGPVLTINCPFTTTCTVQADQFIQVGGDLQAGDEFTIGFYLDGSYVADEQQAGQPPTDGLYTAGAVSEYQTGVTPGNHTVQPYIYSVFGKAKVYNYNVNFRVYTP
jgi:hypothetical protein